MMNKVSLFVCIVLLLTGVLLLIGCVSREKFIKSNCEKPYLFVHNICCLDKNNNKICDVDETQRAKTILREKPLVIVEEICHLPRFSCQHKEITPDFIKFVLKFERDEIIKVRKMTIKELQCSKELYFDLNFSDTFEVTIPCVINGDVVKSEVFTEVVIQPILRYSNGQIYDYGILTPATLRGEVSGLVQG